MNRATAPVPDRALEFVVLSFEGPDPYSMVGGLGVRVTEMTDTLARLGFSTHLVFVGGPNAPAVEISYEGRLTLHRWCRWLSKRFPHNVYDGEREKVRDMEASLPTVVVDQLVTRNAARGVTTVVLAEDWQTASTLAAIGEILEQRGLLEHCVLLWNANNTFGFEGIDWAGLTRHAHLLTVSRYMREKMRALELEPLVVQNGIPARFWAEVDRTAGRRLREMAPGLLLTKVGRYHPDKRWRMAVAAVAETKRLGLNPLMIVRGGREQFGQVVRRKALELGLRWTKVCPASLATEEILAAIQGATDADIIELDFFVPETFLRTLYWASHAVLANSGHEPFGLVGLEVMACGGVPITGSTGEEYLLSFFNGIALGSDDPLEITVYLEELLKSSELERSLRQSGRITSKLFAWEIVLRDLLRKIEFLARRQGVILRDRAESDG